MSVMPSDMESSSTNTAKRQRITVTSIDKNQFDQRIVDLINRGYIVIQEGSGMQYGVYFNRTTYWAKLERVL
jgi:hypothetical protein